MSFLRGLGVGLMIGAAYEYLNLIPVLGPSIVQYKPFIYLAVGILLFYIGGKKA